MTPRLFTVTRQFAVGTVVDLFELDLTPLGGALYRFTNNVFEERVPIKFGGHDFIQMPINMDDVEVDSQGAPAQPKFQIATAGGPIGALLAQYKDLKGAYIRRYCTFAEFLDIKPDPDNDGEMIPNPGADSTAIINMDLYIVDRKVGSDATGAELQLVAPTDQEGVQLPLRIVRKRWCDSHYRIPDVDEGSGFFNFEPADGGCPYRGAAMFDVNDEPTTDPSKDRCSKMVTGCVARFGKTVALPYSALPGIRSTQEVG